LIAEQIIAALKEIKASGGDPVAVVNRVSDAIIDALQPPIHPKAGGVGKFATDSQHKTIT